MLKHRGRLCRLVWLTWLANFVSDSVAVDEGIHIESAHLNGLKKTRLGLADDIVSPLLPLPLHARYRSSPFCRSTLHGLMIEQRLLTL